jgi:hypothetical protein
VKLPNWVSRHVEVQALKTKVAYLEATQKALLEENHKLRRQHELVVTFNWQALATDFTVPFDNIIETLLNYSRRALGQPLWEKPDYSEVKYEEQPCEAPECSGSCRKALDGIDLNDVLQKWAERSVPVGDWPAPPGAIRAWAEEVSKELERNVWPGQPVEPCTGCNGCPDKLEPAREFTADELADLAETVVHLEEIVHLDDAHILTDEELHDILELDHEKKPFKYGHDATPKKEQT